MASATTITSWVKDTRQETRKLHGLRAPRLLAKWPIIGFVMFIFGGLVFCTLGDNLFAYGSLSGYAVGIVWSGRAHALIKRVLQERSIRNVKR